MKSNDYALTKNGEIIKTGSFKEIRKTKKELEKTNPRLSVGGSFYEIYNSPTGHIGKKISGWRLPLWKTNQLSQKEISDFYSSIGI